MSFMRKIRGLLLPDYNEKHWKLYKKAQESDGLYAKILRLRIEAIQRRYGASIPVKPEIKRFETPHQIHGIFISLGAVIEEGCTIFHQVTIGSNTIKGSKRYGAPHLGKNVFVGVGAKIVGGIKIGDGARIGAGCIVTDDVPPNATVVMPKPRVILSEGDRDNTFAHWKD